MGIEKEEILDLFVILFIWEIVFFIFLYVYVLMILKWVLIVSIKMINLIYM